MKSSFVVVLAITALVGCATGQDAQHKQHHPDAATSRTPVATGTGPGSADDQMKMTDMKAMCDMHRKMMSTNIPEERRAMMDERMKNMSPEMMQKHMEQMQATCK